MKYILFLSFLFTWTFSANAQLKKTIHQTFDLEEINLVQLDLYGEYVIEPWAGNSIMSETKVELYEASPAILKFFLEEKERYKINVVAENGTVHLDSNDKERRTIQYRGTDCFEAVKLKLYVPEEYEIVNNRTLKKKQK